MSGVVRFEAAPDGTMVSFSANMESDIIKVGKHGFHVHQDPVQGGKIIAKAWVIIKKVRIIVRGHSQFTYYVITKGEGGSDW